MKNMNKDKPSIIMRLDHMLTIFSYAIYYILSIFAIGIFVPILIEIVYGASMIEVKDAFLRLGMLGHILWPAMSGVALFILIIIGIFIIRAWIALVGWISGGEI